MPESHEKFFPLCLLNKTMSLTSLYQLTLKIAYNTEMTHLKIEHDLISEMSRFYQSKKNMNKKNTKSHFFLFKSIFFPALKY